MTKPLMARLDRLLANLGYGSRREVQAMVAAGRVVLDGVAVRDAGARIAVTADLPARMSVGGQPVDPPAPPPPRPVAEGIATAKAALVAGQERS